MRKPSQAEEMSLCHFCIVYFIGSLSLRRDIDVFGVIFVWYNISLITAGLVVQLEIFTA